MLTNAVFRIHLVWGVVPYVSIISRLIFFFFLLFFLVLVSFLLGNPTWFLTLKFSRCTEFIPNLLPRCIGVNSTYGISSLRSSTCLKQLSFFVLFSSYTSCISVKIFSFVLIVSFVFFSSLMFS